MFLFGISICRPFNPNIAHHKHSSDLYLVSGIACKVQTKACDHSEMFVGTLSIQHSTVCQCTGNEDVDTSPIMQCKYRPLLPYQWGRYNLVNPSYWSFSCRLSNSNDIYKQYTLATFSKMFLMHYILLHTQTANNASLYMSLTATVQI